MNQPAQQSVYEWVQDRVFDGDPNWRTSVTTQTPALSTKDAFAKAVAAKDYREIVIIAEKAGKLEELAEIAGIGTKTLGIVRRCGTLSKNQQNKLTDAVSRLTV